MARGTAFCDCVVSLALAALLACSVSSAAHASDISGVPRIVDGDTLAIGEVKIRLEGIDAPETDQICLDHNAAKWPCGIVARDRLIEHINSRPIDCTPSGHDRFVRTLAVWRLGNENLNAWLVREGWAIAFVRYSAICLNDEEQARRAQRGLWAGAFIAPWDWRRRDKGTEVRGALVVPITAQAILLAPASAAEAPSPNCTIKGNVNRQGDRIYHLPGGLSYAKVNMQAPGKRWFCTEAEAQAAGWRPAKR
jgi:endonuclease YncB( thermonuclease family)